MESYFIQTERLSFREFKESDISFIFELDSDEKVMEFIRPPTKTIEEATATYHKIITTRKKDLRFGNWIAVTKDTNEAIGWFCLKDLDNTAEIEVGYRLKYRFWGKGYATEGAKALIEYGFNKCGLTTIVGVTSQTNVRSQHVLEKCGLQFVKHAFIYETNVRYFAINK